MSIFAEEQLAARDQHLFAPGRKRILSLDGGGLRGVVSLAFLERIEAVLSDLRGVKARLSDSFDLIGGTSTGAIIASALALGCSTSDLKSFYFEKSGRVFERRFYLPFLQSKYNHNALREEIEAVVGDRALGSLDILTGLGIIIKRMDTGRTWIVTNNPRSNYWEECDHGPGNKLARLSLLIRASTAAPTYFDPETEPLFEGGRNSLLVDGGVTPHNNPALALFFVATLDAYGIGWPLGPNDLSIFSIGTGSYRRQHERGSNPFLRNLKMSLASLTSLFDDTGDLVLQMMEWLGESPVRWAVGFEHGTALTDRFRDPLFRFFRFNVILEQKWLSDELGIKASETELKKLRRMDDTGSVKALYEIGRVAADKFIKPESFQVERFMD